LKNKWGNLSNNSIEAIKVNNYKVNNGCTLTLTPELRLLEYSGRADILADLRGDDLADFTLSCLGGTGICEIR